MVVHGSCQDRQNHCQRERWQDTRTVRHQRYQSQSTKIICHTDFTQSVVRRHCHRSISTELCRWWTRHEHQLSNRWIRWKILQNHESICDQCRACGTHESVRRHGQPIPIWSISVGTGIQGLQTKRIIRRRNHHLSSTESTRAKSVLHRRGQYANTLGDAVR